MIKATNISRHLDDTSILTAVSCSVGEGEILALIGQSGSGKTTLLRALAGLDRCHSGSLTVGTTTVSFPLAPTTTHPIQSLYPSLTVVFQQLFIWPHLTIRQNLTLPLRDTFNADRFDDLITWFAMEPFLDRYPNQVSMGQRQRASIVRALLLMPRFLL